MTKDDKWFNDEIWEEAKKVAKFYEVEVSRDDLCGFKGHCIEIPYITAESGNLMECHILLEEAITKEVAKHLDNGGPIELIKLHGKLDEEKALKEAEALEEEMFALDDTLRCPKEIKITEVAQIINKMVDDGDLREHDFCIDEHHVCCEGDDLGFYQQACDFLFSKMSEYEKLIGKNVEYQNKIAKLEEKLSIKEQENDRK